MHRHRAAGVVGDEQEPAVRRDRQVRRVGAAGRLDRERGQLTVLGAEPHLPYDRPPLSKQLLAGTWEPDKVMLRKRDHYDGLKAQFILGDPAVSLDTDVRLVRTACGREDCSWNVKPIAGPSPGPGLT